MSSPKVYKLPYTKYDLYYAPKTKDSKGAGGDLYIKFSTGRIEKL